MTRLFLFLAGWCGWFVVFMAFMIWITGNGYVSPRMLELSGMATLSAEGRANINDALTSFPQLPFLIASAVRWMTDSGLPSIVATAITTSLAAAISVSYLRSSGYKSAPAILIVAGILGNAVFLFGISEGVAPALLFMGLLLFFEGLLGLRQEGGAPQVMGVSFGMAMIGFSHPYGLIFCFAALPFLLLAVPPSVIARSSLGVLMALLFPLLFGVLGLAYVNWLFIQDAWAFIGPARKSFEPNFLDSSLTADLVSTAISLVAVSPIVLIALSWMRRQTKTLWSTIAALGITIASATFGLVFGYTSHPGVVLMPALALALATAARWPVAPGRFAKVFGLVLAGAVGGLLVVFLSERPDAVNFRAAASGRKIDPPSYSAERDLAEFLLPRTDVLLDAKGNPGLMGWRGTARGLVLSGDVAFENSLFTRRLMTRFVALRDRDDEPTRTDRVMAAFDNLYMRGDPKYRMIYDKGGWRVFERNE